MKPIFIAFSSGFITVSTLFAAGCPGAIFVNSMSLFVAKDSISLELNGRPLSLFCVSGLPNALYVSDKTGNTLFAEVDLTILATGNLEARSCITTMWFFDPISPISGTNPYCTYISGLFIVQVSIKRKFLS